MLTVVGVALSLVFTGLTFYGLGWSEGRLTLTPRMSLESLGAALEQTHFSTALLFVLLTWVTLPVRAWRWGLIVLPHGRLRDRYHAVTIGFMAVNLLPARVGEVTRGLVLASRVPGLSRATAVGSVLHARVLDLIGLWILCLPLPLFLDLKGDARTTTTLGFALMSGLVVGCAVLLRLVGSQRDRLVAWTERYFRKPITDGLARFMEGLATKPGGTRSLAALGASMLVQAISALAYVPVIRQLAPEASPIPAAIFGLTVASLGLAIPSTPSGVGVYHFALAFALRTVGVTPAHAAAIAIVTHLGSLLAFVGAGLVSMLAGRTRVDDVGAPVT